jgi:hypothetical protein
MCTTGCVPCVWPWHTGVPESSALTLAAGRALLMLHPPTCTYVGRALLSSSHAATTNSLEPRGFGPRRWLTVPAGVRVWRCGVVCDRFGRNHTCKYIMKYIIARAMPRHASMIADWSMSVWACCMHMRAWRGASVRLVCVAYSSLDPLQRQTVQSSNSWVTLLPPRPRSRTSTRAVMREQVKVNQKTFRSLPSSDEFRSKIQIRKSNAMGAAHSSPRPVLC